MAGLPNGIDPEPNAVREAGLWDEAPVKPLPDVVEPGRIQMTSGGGPAQWEPEASMCRSTAPA